MFAIHEPFTQQMSDCLKTTSMGLGLVRLLQDAKRFDEAKTVLAVLEVGAEKSSREANRLKDVARPASILIDSGEMPVTIA